MYKWTVKEFVSKSDNDKEYMIEYPAAKTICEEIDELMRTEVTEQANRVS